MEDVIDLQMPEVGDIGVKIVVKSVFQTGGLHVEALFFFYEDTNVAHKDVFFICWQKYEIISKFIKPNIHPIRISAKNVIFAR